MKDKNSLIFIERKESQLPCSKYDQNYYFKFYDTDICIARLKNNNGYDVILSPFVYFNLYYYIDEWTISIINKVPMNDKEFVDFINEGQRINELINELSIFFDLNKENENV